MPDIFADPTQGLAGELATFAERGDAFDKAGRFPERAVSMLRRTGLLAAPVPRQLGGLGLGTSPAAGPALEKVLRELGAAWLPLARVYEGHVNALRLVVRYGSAEQVRRAADDARTHLFAIWAAERQPVRLLEGVLIGTKSFASAAGVATRPVVTIQVDGHERMACLALDPGEARVTLRPDVVGMRGAGTAAICLDGIMVTVADLIGRPGDYMRQPEISLGAWRALPGLVGGLSALTAEIRRALRMRPPDALGLARFGQMTLACETATLWAERVAVAAEAEDAGEDAAAMVKLARHAVDQACTLVIDHARRAVGLAGFVRPHPIERLCRDLDTYRRQPALDEVLLEAAQHYLEAR